MRLLIENKCFQQDRNEFSVQVKRMKVENGQIFLDGVSIETAACLGIKCAGLKRLNHVRFFCQGCHSSML